MSFFFIFYCLSDLEAREVEAISNLSLIPVTYLDSAIDFFAFGVTIGDVAFRLFFSGSTQIRSVGHEFIFKYFL